MISCWEKYSLSPLDWDKLDIQTKADLLMKLMLDNEREARIHKQMSEKQNKRAR
ncbi:hypothetical protein [Halocella sp. SP3-1]|uniref:hypothetical protein n=1 Tax=Halocella sp. SP3-1 TaxID=2382161 RepID=UPI0013E0229D|nr:hypothetical protein [Halocella sp. SP3-1]